MVGELARRSIKKHEKNVQLIRYNSHICYVDNNHALIKAFHCPTCDTNVQKTGNLERHLVRCSDRWSIYIQRMCINSDKRILISLTRSISNTQINRNSFFNLAVFDFESICIPEEKFKNTEMTTWIGKHDPISDSISSNLISEHIFLRNFNPRDSVELFQHAVEGWPTQSKTQMKMKFLEVETTIKSKLTRTLVSLNERRCRNQRILEFDDQCYEDDNEEKDASFPFITPLLLFYLDLGLVCKKFHHFVDYIPVKCFNKLVPSAVNCQWLFSKDSVTWTNLRS